MATFVDINDAQTFFRTFAELLASGQDDKHVSRKLGCSRGEVKRRRQTFTELGIISAEAVAGEKLEAWLQSNEGRSAQHQWEVHHRRQQTMGATGTKPIKGIQKPEIKRTWNRPKV